MSSISNLTVKPYSGSFKGIIIIIAVCMPPTEFRERYGEAERVGEGHRSRRWKQLSSLSPIYSFTDSYTCSHTVLLKEKSEGKCTVKQMKTNVISLLRDVQ